MKKDKLPSIVSILILTLMTVILWISLSIYHAFTVKPAASVSSEISATLTPTLDQDTIKQIESGVYLDSSEIPDNVTGSPLVTPIASPSASPNPTP